MRSFHWFVWSLLTFGGSAQLSNSFRPLEGVFGKVEPVEDMVAPRIKKKNIRGKIAREEKFPLSVLIVQDSTASFKEAFRTIAESEIRAFIESMDERHPSSSYALISFSNEETNSSSVEYISDFTEDPEVLEQFYATTIPNGESETKYGRNFEALMAAAQSNLDWPSDKVRLVVHVTDKVPRFFGDLPGDQSELDKFPSSSFVEDSNKTKTHSPGQVASSMKARGVYLAHLILSSEYLTGDVGQSWKWFNRFMGQTDDFINLISADGSDFAEKALSVISKVEEIELGGKTSSELRRLQSDPAKTLRPTTGTYKIEKKGVKVKFGYVPAKVNVYEGTDSLFIESFGR